MFACSARALQVSYAIHSLYMGPKCASLDTYIHAYIHRKNVPAIRLGWLAPAHQSPLYTYEGINVVNEATYVVQHWWCWL